MKPEKFLTWIREGDHYRATDRPAGVWKRGNTWSAFVGDLEITGCPTVDAAQTAASVALCLGVAS
jgi:hypothetical protein